MDRDELWTATESQRLALADLLESLAPDEWDGPSLCDGWRVRDVAAHVTLSARARPLVAVVGLVRARGDFNRFVADDARARAERQPGELVAELRRIAPSRRHPPGTRPVDPLVDVLVHTQDVALPLGLQHRAPVDALSAAADRVWSMSFPFHARRRAAGVRLTATDADWSRGSGEEARGPLSAILLVSTGRGAGADLLDGPGAEVLRERFGPASTESRSR